MARIGIIINPYARKNIRRKDALRAKLEKIGGDLVDVRITYSLEDVEEAGKDFHRQNIEILGICGGDGSLCVTLSRLLYLWEGETFPLLMMLKGGTMNMVCASVGVKKKAETVLARVVRSMKKNKPLNTVERDTMSVDGRIGFLFGLGMSANYLDIYYDGPGTGPWKAFKVLVRAIFSTLIGGSFGKRLWKPAEFVLRWRSQQGRTRKFDQTSFLAVLSCTIQNLGIGFTPTYRAFERPRYMHLLAPALTPLGLVLRLHKVFFGRPFNHPKVLDVVTDHWEFETPDQLKYFLDGELYTTEQEKTVMKIGPRFKLISI
jgi:diacylglycerol kinase (ATP)